MFDLTMVIAALFRVDDFGSEVCLMMTMNLNGAGLMNGRRDQKKMEEMIWRRGSGWVVEEGSHQRVGGGDGRKRRRVG